MAVEGKLVPQDAANESASELFERIREEKHKLIAKGKAKFPKGGESVICIGSDGFPHEKRVDAKGSVPSSCPPAQLGAAVVRAVRVVAYGGDKT